MGVGGGGLHYEGVGDGLIKGVGDGGGLKMEEFFKVDGGVGMVKREEAKLEEDGGIMDGGFAV